VTGADPYGLERFTQAQDAGGSYRRAVAELRRGRKTGHWMWYVFPQLAGLGHSPMAQHYAIRSLAEARAYLAHPVLGPRLAECAGLLAAAPGPPEAILGGIDALKLRSSVTLFLRADPGQPVFAAVLDQHYQGEPDPRTDALLARLRPDPPGPDT
jgi:uncharacterized protein (DUF1810 family)